MRKTRPGKHQLTRCKSANMIPDEYLANTVDDQVQLIVVVIVPAHERAWKPMFQIVNRLLAGLELCQHVVSGHRIAAVNGNGLHDAMLRTTDIHNDVGLNQAIEFGQRIGTADRPHER